MKTSWIGFAGLAPLLLLWATAAESVTPVEFHRDIKPILVRRCVACHGPEKQKAGLRLDRKADAMRGGESGKPVILPGKADKSPLLQRLTTHDEDERMPPKGDRLTTAQIALVKRWIDQGAPWPDTQKHWAFVPVARPAVPVVRGTGVMEYWSDGTKPSKSITPPLQHSSTPLNPIDSFILAKLEARGWQPSPPAEPRALLRRVFLDLTGLPPTLAEQERWLADTSPAAWSRLVDDLLARPAYGERWGRHWLDLARYAETNGYERDATKPNAWRYRDYVIAAFNADKPYDRFIREQIAGDELADASAETLIATGFHRLGPWDDEPADPVQDRADQLDDIIRTTSQVFLGVTLGCARCHDHKFDPLTARDYYSWGAVFAPLKRPQAGRGDLDSPAGSRTELAAVAARDQRIGELGKQVEALRAAHRAEFLKSGSSALPAPALEAFRTEAAKQTGEQKELVKKHAKQLDDELAASLPVELKKKASDTEQAIAQLRRDTPDLPRGYFLVEPAGNLPKSHIHLRGRAAIPGDEVTPAVPVSLTARQPEFPAPDGTSRRRLTLANWIASADNPLTARVIVNRVWQQHFGTGLVATPSDFGLIGSAPTHPELLDWLADWFTHEGGWSLKKLHRLILESATWRQRTGGMEYWSGGVVGKKANTPTLQHSITPSSADPQSTLLWRFPYRRLEVEAIRDSVLAVSGTLNPRVGGPSMYPQVPRVVLEGHSDPDKIWPAFNEADASRRTVYAFLKRSLVVPMLEVLDVCDTTQSAERRSVTSIAPQALTLFNGDFVMQQARHFAARLEREAGASRDKQIELAYRLALCRPPKPLELSAMKTYLDREARSLASESVDGRARSPAEAAHEALVQM